MYFSKKSLNKFLGFLVFFLAVYAIAIIAYSAEKRDPSEEEREVMMNMGISWAGVAIVLLLLGSYRITLITI